MSRKTFYLVASLILMLLLGTSYGDVTNILVNPGFESGTTGWTEFGSGLSLSTDSYPHSGSYRLRISDRTEWWMGIQQDVTNKMVIGSTYTVSGWVRTSSSASSYVDIYFLQEDDNGWNYNWVASGIANNSDWVQLSGSFTLNVTGTLAGLNVLFFGPDAGIDLYIDDVNVFGQVPAPPDTNASGNVNLNVRHQVLDGFGAAGAWYEGDVITLGNSQPEIYNILFRDLGLDIYRVRNTYGIDSGYITRSAQIIAAGNTALGRPLRIMNSSWSPPASLKSNGSTVGGTLAKDGGGNYRYADFAQWWRDSLTAWSAAGVNSYYVNMQNEPDWTADWDTCYFKPTQTDANAGYEQAFAALYANLNSMPNRPKLLAPEGANISGTPAYVNALNATDKSNIYGYSHHLYDGSADAPDAFITPMTNLKAAIGDRPLLQTEFSAGGPFTFTDEMNLAKLIHNALTVEEVSAYLYWDLFWASPSGLVTISSTSYTINPVYYAMKHYSYFTDPNWQRVDANTNSTSLRISAFIEPNNQKLSAIILNTNTTTDINLMLSFTGVTITDGNIWRSTSSQNCVLIGSYNPLNKLFLPANSITTLALSSTTEPPDTNAPTPNPMTWATTPIATGPYTITMTATTATDPSGVEYYFVCTTPGGHDSGWQDSFTYTDSGLNPSTQYTYQVKARDKTFYQNETGLSTAQSATTYAPDIIPPYPDPMTWATVPTTTGPYTITMTATTAEDETSPPVQYYFECTNNGSKSSGWQLSPTYTASGLTPNTRYSFRVQARDSAPIPNINGWSSTLSATTQMPPTEVNIIGPWLTGTTHAKENGANRALIFIAHEESASGNPYLSSVTYGGRAMTKIVEVNAVAASGNYVAAFILNEANIVSASDSNFTPTWSGTPSSTAYASVFLQTVGQTTPVGASAKNSSTSSTPNPITTSALATNNGDMVILGATCGNPGSYTLNNGFIEGTDQAFGGTAGATGVTGHKKTPTASSETPSATYSATVNRQAIIGFVVKFAPPIVYQDCQQVQEADLRLSSDLNGDCYVDYLDLEIVALYWLHTDCAGFGNCENSDFEPDGDVDFYDFSNFALQWTQCNDPQDSNCTPNW